MNFFVAFGKQPKKTKNKKKYGIFLKIYLI